MYVLYCTVHTYPEYSVTDIGCCFRFDFLSLLITESWPTRTKRKKTVFSCAGSVCSDSKAWLDMHMQLAGEAVYAGNQPKEMLNFFFLRGRQGAG